MRQKIFIFAALFFLIVILIGLNAVSYVRKEKTPDIEASPNRSTYNTGATGTRAFYDLLAETGRRPTRWQEPPSALLTAAASPQTFVIIGQTRREITDTEIEQLLRWVSEGGRLILIDREPSVELIKTTANWEISYIPSSETLFFDTDPSNSRQMTGDTPAAKPIQPTVLTHQVNAVQPSRFASSASFERFIEGETKKTSPPVEAEPTPPQKEVSTEIVETAALDAPFAHLENTDKTLLVEFPFGTGRIVFLTDPYIVSNGGIELVDNAQLAVNIVASGGGIVAFDEYHQGYGTNNNRLLAYFEGTPLTAIFLQFAVIVGLIFFAQSRRFARPLPENEPDRLSKLEYVSAMAELQQRTKAYDLAIENVYNEFRRRAARLVGADNFTTSRKDLARLIAERGGLDAEKTENLMFKCEDIIHGEPTNKRETLELIGRLREIEKKLGLQRRKER